MEFGRILRHVGMMNIILLLSCPINIQGREPNFDDFVERRGRGREGGGGGDL